MKTAIMDFEMNYEISGNEKADWLILLHGLGGTTRCWKHQLPDFTANYRVLNVEMAGHGGSTPSKVERYSGEIAANHIRLLMDKLGIEKAHILGLSLGTIVQQYFCELFPERVISTVYASPVTKFSRTAAIFNGVSDKVFLKLFSKNTYMKLMAHLMLPGKIHEKSRKFFLQETLKMKEDEFFKWWKLVMEGNHYDFLTKSKVPSLIIAGEKDFSFYEDAVLLKEKYENCELAVIKDAGHITIFQKPTEFNHLVLEFLKKYEINKTGKLVKIA